MRWARSSDLMDLSGGLIPMQNWYAPSLASPAEAGVADWQLADIEQLLRTGASPRGTVLGPMAEVVLHSLQHLEPRDIRAMAVFLRALPPTPERDSGPARGAAAGRDAVLERGAKLYEQHCAHAMASRAKACAAPIRRWPGNRAVTLPVTANLVQVVLHGGFPPATRGNPRPFGMPPLRDPLSATPTWPPC